MNKNEVIVAFNMKDFRLVLNLLSTEWREEISWHFNQSTRSSIEKNYTKAFSSFETSFHFYFENDEDYFVYIIQNDRCKQNTVKQHFPNWFIHPWNYVLFFWKFKCYPIDYIYILRYDFHITKRNPQYVNEVITRRRQRNFNNRQYFKYQHDL